MGLFIISKIINIKKFFFKKFSFTKIDNFFKTINSKHLLNDIKILNNYT